MSSTISSTELVKTIDFSWTGTPRNSPSRAVVAGVGTFTNEIPNPNLDGGIEGWASNSPSYLRLSAVGAKGRATWVATSGTAYYARSTELPINLDSTRRKSFRARVFAITNNSSHQIMVIWLNSEGLEISRVSSAPATDVAEGESAVLLLAGAVIPSGTTAYRIYIGSPGAPSGTVADFEHVMAVNGATLPAIGYFDGAYVDEMENVTARPLLVDGYQSARTSRHIFNDVVGRAYPDVTLVAAGPRRGTLTFVFDSEREALACEQMHVGTFVLTFTDSDLPTATMQYVADGQITRQLDPQSRSLWLLTVDFQEVSP